MVRPTMGVKTTEHNDILQVEGINSKGFGIVPKLVMQDERLTIYAKAIYAYFCSYAGAGKQAFPRVTRIIKELGISRNAYYRHFNMLRDCGYIKAEQERNAGKLTHNVYTLLQIIPCTTKRDTAPCTTSWDTTAWDTMKRYTNINNSIDNQQLSISNSPSCPTDAAERNITQEIADYTELIHENISYEDFRIDRPYDMRLVDEIVAAVVDVLVSDSSHVRIDGENKPRELVKHVLMELAHDNVELVVAQFKGLTERVHKKRQYLITMLYNSRHELDAHYTNEVKADMG